MLTLESAELGTLKIPPSDCGACSGSVGRRSGDGLGGNETEGSQSDLLIVRKGDILDFVGGPSLVDEQSVAVILAGREVKVPRENVAGVVYATHMRFAPGNPCASRDGTGKSACGEIRRGSGWNAQLELVGIGSIQIPAQSLQSFDFALGRIQPLMKAHFARQTWPTGVSETVVAIRSHAYSPNSFEKVPLKAGRQNLQRRSAGSSQRSWSSR